MFGVLRTLNNRGEINTNLKRFFLMLMPLGKNITQNPPRRSNKKSIVLSNKLTNRQARSADIQMIVLAH